MINFRYHVVSLTAVFLALAIGLVMGTAALNGPAADELSNKVNALSAQNQQYRAQVNQLEADASKQEQFANQMAWVTLQNKLLSRRVVIVSMSASTSYVAGVVQMLGLAGAKVTGQIQLDDSFADPNNSARLLELANQVAPASLTNLPANSNGVETASYLLGSVLLEHTPVIPADTIRTVLKAYTEGQFITVSGDGVTGPAEAILLIAARPYTDREADGKNASMLTMADQFDKVGPLLVAANGAAGTGNVVAALRGDPTLSKTISTVDNVATPQGQITTVLALTQQLVEHKVGHYGNDSGATAMVPPKPAT
ncbi:MAG TPA: copper transporter [Rugosimonospora sp.]|nr:copper transporter [Rugosimonospora sp.]